MTESLKIQYENHLNKYEKRLNLLQNQLTITVKEKDEILVKHNLNSLKLQAALSDLESLRKEKSQIEEKIKLIEDNNNNIESRMNNLSEKESETLRKLLEENTKLEQNNFELSVSKTQLSKENQELTIQLSYYKNMIDEAERYRELKEKYHMGMENEINVKQKEIYELKQEKINIVNDKSAEIISLKYEISQYKQQIEELTRTIESLNKVKDIAKDKISLDDKNLNIINELRQTVSRLQMELNDKMIECHTINHINEMKTSELEHKNKDIRQSLHEYNKKFEDLMKLNKDKDLEIKKLKMDLENQKKIHDTIENFQVPMFDKDRIEQITKKSLEFEKKYLKEKELNNKLTDEIAKLHSELTNRMESILKKEQEVLKTNFPLLISKLQANSLKYKQNEASAKCLARELDIKNRNILELHHDIEDLMTKIKNLNLENNHLKMLMNKYDPQLNLSYLSQMQINSSKDEEIKQLKSNNDSLRQELNNLEKTRLNYLEFNRIKKELNELKGDLDEKDQTIMELLNQINLLKEANNLSSLLEESSKFVLNTKKHNENINKESKMDIDDKIKAISQENMNQIMGKKLELESFKKRIYEENTDLINQVKVLQKENYNMKFRIESMQSLNEGYETKIKLLEKDNKTKNEAIYNRQNIIDQLQQDLDKLNKENKQINDKLTQFHEEYDKLALNNTLIEESAKRSSKLIKELLADKQTYLKALLERQKDIAQLEKKHEIAMNKLLAQNTSLKNEITSLRNEYHLYITNHEDKLLLLRSKIENQDIIIANYMNKTQIQQQIIKELNTKLDDFSKNYDINIEKDIQNLADMNSVLFKSQLTAEDYKNFEAIKDLQLQQKSQYEETIKALENTINIIASKFFALEKKYNQEKVDYEEKISTLEEEKAKLIKNYEDRLKEYEEERSANHEGEMVGLEEESTTIDSEEIKLMRQVIDSSKREIEALTNELNIEKETKLRIQNDLQKEKQRVNELNSEILILGSTREKSEQEKIQLAKIYAVKEVSWYQQRKELYEQIKNYRDEESHLNMQIREVLDKIEQERDKEKMKEEKGGKINQGEEETQQGEGEGEKEEQEIVIVEGEEYEGSSLLTEETLRRENQILREMLNQREQLENHIKKPGESKPREEASYAQNNTIINRLNDEIRILRAEKESLQQKIRQCEQERNALQNEYDEMKLRLRVFDDYMKVDVNDDSIKPLQEELENVDIGDQDLLSLKDIINNSNLVNTLERARTLLTTLLPQ